jgi:RNA-binding protein
MITTKQRAQLRALANPLEVILQVGKGGIIDTLVKQVDDALTARELIKIKVLENAPVNAREVAQELAEKTGADVVQVIGMKVSLYRRNNKEPKIVLVK